MKFKNLVNVAVALGVLVMTVSGCGGSSPKVAGGDIDSILVEIDKELPQIKNLKGKGLVGYDSCDELENEIRYMYISRVKSWAKNEANRCYSSIVTDIVDPTIGSSGGAEESFDVPNSSGTNVQERGVDEADLIKMGGEYVYSIVGEKVKISKVWPFEDFGEVAIVNVAHNPHSLYLANDKLVIISKAELKVFVDIFDITDPSNPTLVENSEYSGDLLSSRVVDRFLYVVTNENLGSLNTDFSISYSDIPECPQSGEVKPSVQRVSKIAHVAKNNIAIINKTPMRNILPATRDFDDDDSCVTITRSHGSMGSSILTVTTDEIDNDENVESVSILGNGGTVYVSNKSIFLSGKYDTRADAFIPLGEEDDQKTVIHRFMIEKIYPRYFGSNVVDGHVVDNNFAGSRRSDRYSMNQFAMSEYEDHLRIATTVMKEDGWDNMVTVLDSQDPELREVGRVDGLGRQERIYAVRFSKNKGYIVTFIRVDPLYVIDLSDPTNPVMAGELKIPGFSTYLHPLGEDRLIGLGFGASGGWTQGVKVSLFDVSDPANPSEIGHRMIGERGSYSAAVEEHHAFTLDFERNLLSLPIDVYGGGSGASSVSSQSYVGVMLLNLDNDGSFPTFGEIRLSDLTSQYSDRNAGAVLRTVIIGDGEDEGVIILTNKDLRLHSLSGEMEEIGKVE